MVFQLRFDNRVVIVTGAGSGLGKAFAIEFAKRGAKVLVNDLGCSLTGLNRSNDPADKTVKEIKQAGGIAVANYDSAEFGDKIIKSAINAFGRIDVVINNAGILRDKSMSKMTEEDWDLVLNYNLKSAFSITKASWGYMKKQKYGRIINISSGAGLFGNFGQANYSSAKIGLHGLTLALSKEGEKYNIKVNTIVPIGDSRMTDGILPLEILEILSPDKISPLAAVLGHESCHDNGNLFETVGGWIAKIRWQRGKGKFFAKPFSPEDIKLYWKDINSFDNPDYPRSSSDIIKRVGTFVDETHYPKPKL